MGLSVGCGEPVNRIKNESSMIVTLRNTQHSDIALQEAIYVMFNTIHRERNRLDRCGSFLTASYESYNNYDSSVSCFFIKKAPVNGYPQGLLELSLAVTYFHMGKPH
ncbi:MAG: hypothetical protein GY938_10650, partial [Ketobacter sp.]|nr:hypothetical protein [Ketobacter sp.]